MKKLITIILTLCMCFTLGISLTACDFLFQEPEHTHAYTKTIATEDYLKSEATCLSKAEYYKSCECGEKGTESFESGELSPCVYENGKCKWCEEDEPIIHTHTYDKQVAESKYLKEEANCKTKAVYWLSCECGDKGTNTFEYGSMLSHTYDKQVAENKYLKEEATCISKAIYWLSCECGNKGTDTFEYGDFAEHDFSLTWTKENGKHWHACQTVGCLVTSNEENHSYINGECICGELEPVVDINEVSLTQWESAFEFENVTINQYLVISQGQNILVGTYLIDGSNAAMSIEGTTIPMEGYADFIRMNFDFSNCYTFAEYQDGKYFIDSFDVYGDGSYVYEDAYLTFENGVLKSITATIKEEVPEYDDDYNEIGSTIETNSSFIEFVDYGTTTITIVENTLPITQQEWEALFATENFNNMTIVASFSVRNTAYVENIYYNNGNEKITVTGYNNVELYYVNSTWYTYAVSENTFVETDVFGAEYPYVTLSDSFKNFLSMVKNLYTLINYDATEDTYYYTSDSDSYYITIDDRKVVSLTTIFNIEGETSVYSYTISNYGTTSFVIPFDPTHICNFQKIVNNDFLIEEATCSSKAVYVKSCSCGKKGNDTFESGELKTHIFDRQLVNNKYLNIEATCKQKAKYFYSCECGYKGTETFEIGEFGPHAFGEIISELPTSCMQNGTKAHKVCSICNKNFDNDGNELETLTIPIVPHTFSDGICTICGEEEPTKELEYTLNADGNSYAVTGISDNNLTKIVIPKTYNGKKITEIKTGVFKGCTSLVSITLPFVGAAPTTTNVDGQAFGYIFGYIKNSSSTMNGATQHVLAYGYWYHYYVPISLKKVTVIGTVDGPVDIHSSAFRGCKQLTEIILEYGIRHIEHSAFYECSGLTSITIPDSVISITENAFAGCSGLTSITIPDNIKTIGARAFAGCSGLTNITILNTTASINAGTFLGCINLESITVSVNNTAYKSENNCLLTKDGKRLILASQNSIIPNGVTSIGSCAFQWKITSITIPSSVTYIEPDAFSCNYSTITSVIFENTQGWRVCQNKDMNSASLTSLSSYQLANASTAANFLRNTYNNYYWRRYY